MALTIRVSLVLLLLSLAWISECLDHGEKNVGSVNHGYGIRNAGEDGYGIRNAGEDGYDIRNAGEDGYNIRNAGEDGYDIGNVGEDGYGIRNAGEVGYGIRNAWEVGYDIRNAGEDGYDIRNAGEDGYDIRNAGEDGYDIRNAGEDGYGIRNAGEDGYDIRNSGEDGYDIRNAGEDGYGIRNAGEDGYDIRNAGEDGYGIRNAGEDGYDIRNAGEDGYGIRNAGEDGYDIRNAGEDSSRSNGNLDSKHHQQRSRDVSKEADFPCPIASAIAPCVCSVDAQNNVNLDCTNVVSEEQLEKVFQQEFPVKELHEFLMTNNTAVLMLGNVLNEVSFERVVLAPGPFALTGISEYFLLGMKSSLQHLQVEASALSSDSFPFATLVAMEALTALQIEGSHVTWIPSINSGSIEDLRFTGALTEVVEPGTLDNVPMNRLLALYDNSLTELRAGTIPVRDGMLAFDCYNNSIQAIEPGTFYVLTNSTSSNHLIHIDLNHNGLELLLPNTFPLRQGVFSLSVTHNNIRDIAPGTFMVMAEAGPGSERIFIDLSFNSLQSLRAGTFPLRDGPMSILLYENKISSIEPGAFVLPESTVTLTIVLHLDLNELTTVDEAVFGPLMPFVEDLRLHDNPLSCGCDIAWLVLTPEFLAKVDSETKCGNGTFIYDLDPQAFLDFC